MFYCPLDPWHIRNGAKISGFGWSSDENIIQFFFSSIEKQNNNDFLCNWIHFFYLLIITQNANKLLPFLFAINKKWRKKPSVDMSSKADEKKITKQKRQKKTNKNFVSLDLVELPLLLQSTAVIFDCAKKTDNKRKKSNWISWQNEELSLWWSTSLSILCETDSILTNESTFSHNSAKRVSVYAARFEYVPMKTDREQSFM